MVNCEFLRFEGVEDGGLNDILIREIRVFVALRKCLISLRWIANLENL